MCCPIRLASAAPTAVSSSAESDRARARFSAYSLRRRPALRARWQERAGLAPRCPARAFRRYGLHRRGLPRHLFALLRAGPRDLAARRGLSAARARSQGILVSDLSAWARLFSAPRLRRPHVD